MKLEILSLLLACGTTLHAGDWPQFRGPLGNGVSDETGVPTVLDANRELAWKADLPGRGLSSPIIVGDRIFVTCSSGLRQQHLHVLCLRASDGSRLWERQFWATGRSMCHEKIAVAAPTPACDGQHVVALFSSSDAVCLDLEGNLLWFRGLGRDYPRSGNSLGMASSLLILGGVALAQIESDSEAFTVGLDLETGANRWKLERPHKANWSSPIPISQEGRQLVLLQSAKSVAAVDPATGTVAWSYAEAGSSVPSSVMSGGVIYVPSRGLTALQPPAQGEQPKALWQSNLLHPSTASPIVIGDKVFTLNDAGILTCGDTANGQRLWQLRLKGPFSATPVAVGRFLYCVSEKGLAQVIDTSKPEGEVVSELDLGETILSTPSVAKGAIYFRSDARLWKIGKSPA